MAIQKRLKKVWNGVTWIEIYHPTSSDLVYVGSESLDDVLQGITDDIDEHITDTTMHTTSAEKTKLSNLPTDANATFATQTALSTHTTNTGIHVSTDQSTVLGDLTGLLPDLPTEIFATKAEVAGKRDTIFAEDLEDLDTQSASFGESEVGMQAFLRDSTGFETTATDFDEGRGAMLMWLRVPDSDPEEFGWFFMYHVGDAEIQLIWGNIEGRPTSTVSNIDEAVTMRHVHESSTSVSNLTILNGFTAPSGTLLWNNNPIGETFNRTYLQDLEPSSPNTGDTWLAPLDEE